MHARVLLQRRELREALVALVAIQAKRVVNHLQISLNRRRAFEASNEVLARAVQ